MKPLILDRTKARLAAAILISVLAGNARAGDILLSTIGTGGFSCGKFVSYETGPQSTEEMDLVVQWVWGYFVAYNSRGFFDVKTGHSVSQINYPDSPTIILYLDQYCKKHPTVTLINGINALLKTVGGHVVGSADASE